MFTHTASVYDLLYESLGKDYAAEAADLQALIERRRPGARTLLDVACGTGGHLRHLQRTYAVTGADLDRAMLVEARRHLPHVPLFEADMRSLSLDQSFDVVLCLFSSVGYLRSTQELDQAVRGMAEHLEPGGVLVVDGWLRPDAWLDDGPTQVTTASGPDLDVVRMVRSRRADNRTTLDMHYLVATHDGIEHLVEHHELTLFTPEQYEAAFAACGLAVSVEAGPYPGRDRYVATRP